MIKDYSDYKFPSSELLDRKSGEQSSLPKAEIINNAEIITNTLLNLGIKTKITDIQRGARITKYKITPDDADSVKKILNAADDIVLGIGLEGVRMLRVFGENSAVAEIPNRMSEFVNISEVIDSFEFKHTRSKTSVCLGEDTAGNLIFADIAKMPHLIISGAIGMGKSKCVSSIITSLLYKARPDEVRLILIDPKKVEFKEYEGLPSLLFPVITDTCEATNALRWACKETKRRLKLIDELGARSIDEYSEKIKTAAEHTEPLPRVIIIIDELFDLIFNEGNNAEELLSEIAEKSGAAGIHLIICTHRPSKGTLTPTIKANIPTRICFKTASYTDSVAVLDESGAQKLLNNGDMLYRPALAPNPIRVQCAYISDSELSRMIHYIKENNNLDSSYSDCAEVYTDFEIPKSSDSSKSKASASSAEDIKNISQFIDAVNLAIRKGSISTSVLQINMGLSYSRAENIIKAMQCAGIISERRGDRPPYALITEDEWNKILDGKRK